MRSIVETTTPARQLTHWASVDQPHMTRALDHLKDARNNLEQATPDKGGFRAKAISLVNEAIEEVKLGIAAASD